MNDIYLTPTLKDYYTKDFNENVLNETDEFWKISDSIKDKLILLNGCKNIQPLYSKYPDNFNSLSNSESYLKLAYAKEIELALFRNVLPALLLIFNSEKHTKFEFSFHEPDDNFNWNENISNYKMGCLTNKDYFKINLVRISYSNYDRILQANFWNLLTERLFALGK